MPRLPKNIYVLYSLKYSLLLFYDTTLFPPNCFLMPIRIKSPTSEITCTAGMTVQLYSKTHTKLLQDPDTTQKKTNQIAAYVRHLT